MTRFHMQQHLEYFVSIIETNHVDAPSCREKAPVTTGIPADTAGLNASVIATKNGLKRMAAPIGPGASLTGVQC